MIVLATNMKKQDKREHIYQCSAFILKLIFFASFWVLIIMRATVNNPFISVHEFNDILICLVFVAGNTTAKNKQRDGGKKTRLRYSSATTFKQLNNCWI